MMGAIWPADASLRPTHSSTAGGVGQFRRERRAERDSNHTASSDSALRLDFELTREFCISVFLLGEEFSEFGTAKEIDKHPLTFKPFGDVGCCDSIGNGLRKLGKHFFWCLCRSNKT